MRMRWSMDTSEATPLYASHFATGTGTGPRGMAPDPIGALCLARARALYTLVHNAG